ncbi:M16 family metallopeptidase [Mucilaginibacter auburnensis]|uniref:Putative Zn-dependent peptidase n=1 Tax=Mucilaginibacter auburnensis TaxID=1457233 RepID=A0A2H9VUV8_9SPHI|nr:M16 family metallopeptidase [Mucilaginibacter auburnensis]PJJ84591.1 putative Zn-dependent peptidase [Mucilaginibacter auburnensis]
MKHKILLIAFLFVIAQQLSAQTTNAWKQATAGGYTYKYVPGDPTNSRFYTLKNGLTVILSPTKKQPRVQTYIAVKAGSKTDPANHTGLAHYLEHMLFKGTDVYGSLNWAKEKPLLAKIDALYEQYNNTTDEAKRKEIYKEIDKASGEAAKYAIANEYDKMMAAMGGQNSNAFTSFEQTVYTEDIPANAVDKYLKVQAERFRNPIMRIFHTELEAVYEEKNRTLDDDGRKVNEAMFKLLFPNNNYGKQTTIGTVEHLRNPSLVDIRRYYNDYYVPNNMGVIMSGDFNPDVVIKKIDMAFKYMKPKAIPPYKFDPEQAITSPVKADVYGPNAESVTMAFRFPGANTRDARLLDLMGSILTNGKAGLFDLDLVKKQKLLSATAGSYALKDYGVLLLRGNPVKGQSLDEVRDLMLGEIAKLRNGEFSDDLIQSIVNNEKKRLLQQNQDYSSRADDLMSAFTSGVDWKNVVGLIKELSAVTKPQIVAFANKYLNNQNYVIVYKHQGEDKNIVKVDKPAITPVDVNSAAQSPFLKQVSAMPTVNIKPVWLDYQKDIQRAKAGSLDVLAVKNVDNSLFRLYYRYEMGGWNNKLLPLAAQYLQFLGTGSKTSEDFSKAFYKLASSYSLSAGNEITTVSFNGLQENFGATIKLYEDLLLNCKADEEALASLKARIKRSRENQKINKSAIMQGLMSYAQYGPKNPYNYGLTNEELDAVTSQDLIKVLHELNNYSHIILYYGPKTAAEAGAEVAALHKVPASFTAYPVAAKFTRVDATANQVLFANYDMVQAEIYWIRNDTPFDPAKEASVEVFNNYFGTGGFSSIVLQDLRESKALAYSTFAQYVTPSKKEDRDFFAAYIGAQADKLNEAVKGMNDLLTTLPESNDGVELAKDNVRKSIETERITEDNIIMSYLSAKRLALDYDLRKTTFESIPKMTFADLKAFHDAHLKNKAYTYCIVASEKRVTDDDLKKYGTLVKPDLKQIFGF